MIEMNDFEAQIAALQNKFRERAEKLDTDMKKAINTCCIKLETDIKTHFTPNGPSAPGEPPAVDTGRLRASITHRVETEGEEIAGYVGTNVEYATDLEFGTSKMAERPFMIPAVERNKEWIKEKLKQVVKKPEDVESET